MGPVFNILQTCFLQQPQSVYLKEMFISLGNNDHGLTYIINVLIVSLKMLL